MASTTDLLIDPDDVVFDEEGNIERMTDPETGENIVSDPKPAEKPAATGPYDDLNREGEENHGGAERQPAATADEQLVLDMVGAYGFVDEQGNPTDTIEWNGQETRVRDLSAEDRREFFEQLREQDRAEAAGITAEEQQLLDYVRQGGDLRELVGAPAEAGASQVAALDADSLNRLDIKQQFPGLSDEEVEQELEDRKAGRLYENKTNALRERLTQQEQVAAEQADQQAFVQEQQEFITAAGTVKEVMGFRIAPEVANYLLQRTATQEENGNSPFLNSLTPEKILKLEFLDTYMPQIQNHYEGQIQAAYKRGKKEALEGAPSTPSGRGGAGARPAAHRAAANTSDFTLGAD